MVGRELDHKPVGQVGRVLLLVRDSDGLSWLRAVEIRGQGFAVVVAGDGHDMHMVADESAASSRRT